MNDRQPIKRKKSHTPQQWRLHNYLKAHSDKFTFRIDILVDLKDFYYESHVTEEEIRKSDIYHTTEAHRLNEDIKELKKSTIIKYILIGNSKKGIKYANKEEAVEYFRVQDESIKSKCILNNQQKAKYGLNGQYVIQFTGYEKPIIESVVE